MAKYIIWDKKSDIYTLAKSPVSGKMHWTAQEYIDEEAPWAGQPNAKVIVSGGPVNGAYFLDFYERLAFYKAQGVTFTDNMTDAQILAAMEAYDDNPPAPEDVEIGEIKEAINILLGGKDDELDSLISSGT